MIKVNKFEAVGIGVSIAAMSLALFLVRFTDTKTLDSNVSATSQSASVIVAGTDAETLGNALTEATGNSGELQRLLVNDVILGEGEGVKKGDTVEVNYIGTLQNGQQFDNSYTKGEPFTFTVGEGKVIKGWEEGILGMKKGGQRILVIPAELAYGSKGFGPIPGNATLVFALELLDIK